MSPFDPVCHLILVEGNVDGNLGADFQIQLTGLKALVAADFIL